MKVNGKGLMLRLGGKTVALATDCSMDLSLELIDAKTKDDGGAKDEAGDVAGTLSTDALLGINEGKNQQTFATLSAAFFARQTVSFEVMVAAGAEGALSGEDWAVGADSAVGFARYGGSALITALKLSGSVQGKAKYSVQLKTQGTISALDGAPLTVSVEGNTLVINGNAMVLDLDYYNNLAVTDGTLNF